MQNNPEEDKLPQCCRTCPNKSRFNYCSPVCTRLKAEKSREADLDLDKQSFDVVTRRLHNKHRHKRW